MKNLNFKRLIVATLIAVVAICINHMLGIGFDDTLIGAAVTPAVPANTGNVADTPVDTTVIKEASPDLLLNDIDEIVTLVEPSKYPLDQITRKGGIMTDKIESTTIEYYTVGTKPISDSILGEVVAADDEYITISVTTASTFAVKDVAVLKGVPAYEGTVVKTGLDLNVIVTAVNVGNNTLTIAPLSGYEVSGDSVFHDTIPAGTSITRSVRLVEEAGVNTAKFGIFPAKDYNHVQRTILQLEETKVAGKHKKEVQWSRAEQSRIGINDMRRACEISFLTGNRRIKSVMIDGEEEQLMTSGGMEYFVDKTITYDAAADFTPDTLEGWWQATCKSIFQGNNGSTTRMAFFSPRLIELIASVPAYSKVLNDGVTKMVSGLEFTEVKTNFGKLQILKHDLLDDIEREGYGYVIDLPYVEHKVFMPLDEKSVDLETSGQKASNRRTYIEMKCSVFKNVDVHAIIKSI